MNRPKRSHIENIIKPILCRHIEQKEHAFTTYAYDYRKITKRVESTLVVPENPNRYDLFIKMVIRDRSDASIPPEVRDNPEYLRECRQAIDISRLLTLTSG